MLQCIVQYVKYFPDTLKVLIFFRSMYAVVLFVDDNAVEAVPQSWVKDEGEKTVCVWPALKGSSLMRAIEQRAPPDPSWKKFKVQVLRDTGQDYVHCK